MTDGTLSKAIAIYIGKGFTKAPLPDKDRLIREAGSVEAQHQLPRILAILEEMEHIPVDFAVMDLNSATDHVIAIMRRNHPELSDTALNALDWLYSWAHR